MICAGSSLRRSPALQVDVIYGRKATFGLRASWLPGLDSNQGQGIQSPLCYHYTTGHRLLGLYQGYDSIVIPRMGVVKTDSADLRQNRRKVMDSERFVSLMRQILGRSTWYCKTPQPENPHA